MICFFNCSCAHFLCITHRKDSTSLRIDFFLHYEAYGHQIQAWIRDWRLRTCTSKRSTQYFLPLLWLYLDWVYVPSLSGRTEMAQQASWLNWCRNCQRRFPSCSPATGIWRTNSHSVKFVFSFLFLFLIFFVCDIIVIFFYRSLFNTTGTSS